MMSSKLAVAVVVVSLVVVVATNGEVSNFSFGKCPEYAPVAAHKPVTSMVDCQSKCKADARCGFFVLYKKTSTCYLVEGSVENFVDGCKLIAGPSHINYQDWLDDADPCKYFVEGTCTYDGNYLEQFPEIQSPLICQHGCQLRPQCDFFHMDTETHICTLKNLDTRICDYAYGPKSPDYSQCQSSN